MSTPIPGGEEANDRLEAACREAARSRSIFYWSMVLLCAGLHYQLMTQNPGSDPPPGWGRDPGLCAHAFERLSPARACAAGEGVGAALGNAPLVNLPAAFLYWVAGPRSAPARAFAALGSVATLLLLAILLRRRFADAPSLLGLILFSIDPAGLVVGRDGIVEPWIAFWSLVAVAAAASGNGRHWWHGGVLTGIAAWGVDPAVLLVVPAILLEGWLRVRRTRDPRARRAGAAWFCLFGTALVLFELFHPEARQMFGGAAASPWWNALRLEARSGLFSAAPLLLPLAAAGTLRFAGWVSHSCGGSRSTERLMHAALWGGVVTLAIADGSALRHLAPLLGPMVYAAVSLANGVAIAVRSSAVPIRPRRALGVAVAPAAALLLVALVQATAAFAPDGVLPHLAAAGIIGASAWIAPRATPAFAKAILFPLCFVLATIPPLARTLALAHRPEMTLARAGEMLPALLLPGARLVGSEAHALGADTGFTTGGQSSGAGHWKELCAEIRARGGSHVVVERPREPVEFFAACREEGLPLFLVECFHIRGRPVLLLRVAISPHRLSSFELGLYALDEGRLEDAERGFLEVLKGTPTCGPAWTRLGQIRSRVGDAEGAYRCYQAAIQTDPSRVQAHVALAGIYMTRDLVREALHHLEQALAAEPGNERIRLEVEKLARSLAEKP